MHYGHARLVGTQPLKVTAPNATGCFTISRRPVVLWWRLGGPTYECVVGRRAATTAFPFLSLAHARGWLLGHYCSINSGRYSKCIVSPKNSANVIPMSRRS